ncbi:MAG: hypothetical protein Q9213_001108 [Squamulea squamosa]
MEVMPAVDIDFDELERASAALRHSIYDTDQFDADQYWYRQSLNTGYEFRLGPRDPELPQPSCWIDQDESGDFDPSEKKTQPVVPLKRKREPALPQLDENGQPVARKPRQATWQFGRFNGYSLPITLKLTSVRGLHLLASGTDNWPADDEPESSNSSRSHDSIFTSPSGDISNTSIESCADPYTFRPREKPCYDEYDQQDVDDEDSKITLGHPAARGCIPCLKLRLPKIPLGRRFVNCTQCRQAKKWCSLRAGQSGPCNRCKTSGIPCTFETLRSRLAEGKIRLDVIPAREQSQDTAASKAKGKRPIFDDPFAAVIPQPITKTITTRLAHPINFNFKPLYPEDKPHCHWCEDIPYGLLGLGTISVTVTAITTISGRESTDGYTELDGGYTSLGRLPSRMCETCTLDRFRIIGCESHELSMLSSIQDIEQDRILDVLFGEGKATWEWCSICPSPALYGCCRTSCIWLEDAGEDLETVGCGLKLCEECAVLLTESEGNLELAVWRKMEEAMGLGGNECTVRADAEFLTRDGELMRQAGGWEGDEAERFKADGWRMKYLGVESR